MNLLSELVSTERGDRRGVPDGKAIARSGEWYGNAQFFPSAQRSSRVG